MNGQKVKGVLSLIRSQGRLPTDQFGQVLSVSDLVGWFGLDGCLTGEEMDCVRAELSAMAEAQTALDRIRIDQQLQVDGRG